MYKLVRVAILAAAAAFGSGLAPSAQAGSGATLQTTIEDVARRWPEIGHVSPAELAALMAQGKAVVFDVRQTAEYRVSHLPGAIHVDPGTWRSTFLKRYGDEVKGKTVVFYCSVGVRSSKLGERVAEGLKARGATAVDDLAGGIFAWHGERRPLVDALGPTDFVHPYDSTWGRLLTRQDMVRTEPRS